MNTSARTVAALRQLPQFSCGIDHVGPATHVLTGVQIWPMGELEDEDDDSNILKVSFPGGPTIEVVGSAYLELQIAEGVRLEVQIQPGEVGVKDKELDAVQLRTRFLSEHLRGKHRITE